jgi:hypothetical protein
MTQLPMTNDQLEIGFLLSKYNWSLVIVSLQKNLSEKKDFFVSPTESETVKS